MTPAQSLRALRRRQKLAADRQLPIAAPAAPAVGDVVMIKKGFAMVVKPEKKRFDFRVEMTMTVSVMATSLEEAGAMMNAKGAEDLIAEGDNLELEIETLPTE